ncbi:hypothetical protein TEA_001716 [Camellia sinensis var. sinensis]|uniref:Uncharacterized protein n=1 Tax=Camellia sinensis var. sinensis TaxID=542762 RepID=A0A4S4DJV8_CAMSN|nr:hypothetical protein TEA_001716 [Camellia sinensis var. sinensis]
MPGSESGKFGAGNQRPMRNSLPLGGKEAARAEFRGLLACSLLKLQCSAVDVFVLVTKLADALETKKNNGVLASRSQVWMAAYMKDGTSNSDSVNEVMTQMNELTEHMEGSSTDPAALQEQIFTQVMGPERLGRVRTFGLGPSPTDVFGGGYRRSQEHNHLFQTQVQEQVQEQLQRYQMQFESKMNEVMEKQIQAIRTDFQSRIQFLESQLQAAGVPVDLVVAPSNPLHRQQVVDSLSSHPTIRPMSHQQQSHAFSSQEVPKPRVSNDSLVKEYHNARLEAINAKERGDKKGQQQASQIIRKLKQEISALGLSDEILASGHDSSSFSASDDAFHSFIPSKHPETLALCNEEGDMASVLPAVESKVNGKGLTLLDLSPEQSPVSVPAPALEEESGDVELGSFFLEDVLPGDVLPPEVVELQKKEKMRELASGKNLEKLEGIWKKGDPQRIPKAVLQQLCQKSGWEAPKYNKVLGKENNSSYAISILRKASGRGKSRKAGGLVTLQLPSQDETSESAEVSWYRRFLMELTSMITLMAVPFEDDIVVAGVVLERVDSTDSTLSIIEEVLV